MLDRGLFDVSAGANKRNAAYTTHMREYAAPYLFMQWTPSPDSVTTFLHEMGHYCASYYRNDGYSYCSWAPLDLFEIESQGLELLFLEYYDELFAHSDAAAYTTVLNIMYALLAGCMEDEFQQRLYADPSLDYEDACALYRQLGEEYGFADVYVFEPSSWALVSHTFTSPLYYLSYAVSAITAFELLAASAVDFPKAAETYWQLQDRGESAPLLTTLSACGLSDPFSEETVAAVCRDVEAYLDRLWKNRETRPDRPAAGGARPRRQRFQRWEGFLTPRHNGWPRQKSGLWVASPARHMPRYFVHAQHATLSRLSRANIFLLVFFCYFSF